MYPKVFIYRNVIFFNSSYFFGLVASRGGIFFGLPCVLHSRSSSHVMPSRRLIFQVRFPHQHPIFPHCVRASFLYQASMAKEVSCPLCCFYQIPCQSIINISSVSLHHSSLLPAAVSDCLLNEYSTVRFSLGPQSLSLALSLRL